MHLSIGRRLAGATLSALLAGAASASPAAAQARCTAPERPGWHSCLTASHRAIDGGPKVLLTRVRPRFVERYEDGCPAGRQRRTVVIRANGRRIGRERVDQRCRNGVARWILNLKIDRDFDEGTVIRSFWSSVADDDDAPRVRLKIG